MLCGRSLKQPAHPELSGTIEETKRCAEELGASVHAVQMDLSHEESIREAVHQSVARFGTVDVLINNSSAIYTSKHAKMKHFDLMHAINARGTYAMVQRCLPHLAASGGRILSIAPPLDTLRMGWVLPHAAYTMSKYGMTMATIGVSDVVCANTLWPARLIATAATKMLEKKTAVPGFTKGRSSLLMGEAAWRIATSSHPESGRCYIDEDVVRYEDDEAPPDIFV